MAQQQQSTKFSDNYDVKEELGKSVFPLQNIPKISFFNVLTIFPLITGGPFLSYAGVFSRAPTWSRELGKKYCLNAI